MTWSERAALIVTVTPPDQPLSPLAVDVLRMGLRELFDELRADKQVKPDDPFPLARDPAVRESDILDDYLRGA